VWNACDLSFSCLRYSVLALSTEGTECVAIRHPSWWVIPMQAIVALVEEITDVVRRAVSRRRVRHILNDRKDISIEVGAGNRKGREGWITIDVTRCCDIYWDVRKGLPFPDGCASRIYSSHCLEHLSFPEGQKFLTECLRVLVSGGTFSICVPNARMYIDSYLGYVPLESRLFYPPAFNNTTRIDYVNYMAYMNGLHKYMFDEENLLHVLEARGFRNVRRRGFEPQLDLEMRDYESIYAEAEK